MEYYCQSEHPNSVRIANHLIVLVRCGYTEIQTISRASKASTSLVRQLSAASLICLSFIGVVSVRSWVRSLGAW
jgi:hypothetical protein